MVILPPNPDPAQRFGFVVATSALASLGAGAAGWLVAGGAGLFGAAAGVLVAVLGLCVSPREIVRAYELWNRAAGRYARVARSWIARLCFNFVFLVLGRTGAALPLARPAPQESLWVPRGTLDARAYTSEFLHPASARRWWIAAFAVWAVRTGRPWALALLPFLIVLRFLDPQEDLHLPSGLYTLY
jgi:hypothetical protein